MNTILLSVLTIKLLAPTIEFAALTIKLLELTIEFAGRAIELLGLQSSCQITQLSCQPSQLIFTRYDRIVGLLQFLAEVAHPSFSLCQLR